MLSDNYLDETAENLHSLGYEASFMEEIVGGEEIVIMHKDFSKEETKDVIEFYSVVPGTVKKDRYRTDDGRSDCIMRFVARTERGATKPMSFGGTWGIYVRKTQTEDTTN